MIDLERLDITRLKSRAFIGGPELVERCDHCMAVIVSGECARNGPNCTGVIRNGSASAPNSMKREIPWNMLFLLLGLIFGFAFGVIFQRYIAGII